MFSNSKIGNQSLKFRMGLTPYSPIGTDLPLYYLFQGEIHGINLLSVMTTEGTIGSLRP